MTPDYAPSLLRSFERHLRAENRSDNTIESYLESIRQAEAFLATCGRTLLDARRLCPSSPSRSSPRTACAAC